MDNLIEINTEIKTLIEAIKEEILKGKERIEHMIENEKTTTYWNIGKYRHQYLLKYNDHADYGDALCKLLTIELIIGTSTLTETRGLLYTYQLKPLLENGKTILYIDLGFRMYINKLVKNNNYSENDIVQIHTGNSNRTKQISWAGCSKKAQERITVKKDGGWGCSGLR